MVFKFLVLPLLFLVCDVGHSQHADQQPAVQQGDQGVLLRRLQQVHKGKVFFSRKCAGLTGGDKSYNLFLPKVAI